MNSRSQVTDGKRVVGVSNGVPLLTSITAAGCSVTALIAAFLAVAPEGATLEATAAALAVFGWVGSSWRERMWVLFSV